VFGAGTLAFLIPPAQTGKLLSTFRGFYPTVFSGVSFKFMWHNQTLYRVSSKLAAEGIFSGLDRNLQPDVFLIGFRRNEEHQALEVELEPADLFFRPGLFDPMIPLLLRFEIFELECIKGAGHLPEHDNHQKTEHLQQLRKNLQVILNEENEVQQHELISFCSCPAWVNEFLVFVVLQFRKDAFQGHYVLDQRPNWLTATAPVSLIHATVTEYLNDCSKALRESDFATGKSILDRDYSEVLRSAGKRFMYTPTGSSHSLFDACNAISALKYEGAEGIGSIQLSRRNHPEIYQLLTLDTPVPLRDYRSVRKLLELAEGTIRLLSDATYVYGLGSLKPGYDFAEGDVFLVKFTKHYTWEFLHAGHVLMRVAYGLPSLPKGQLDENKFRKNMGLTFPDLPEEQLHQLWLLVQEITRLRHGTIVVISEGAKEEATRLAQQGFKLAPVSISPSFIRQLTQIDGALLLDTEGQCHAIGVILDGLASERGDAARGARYNSAIRYVETSKHPCLAIVLSEDGLINVIRVP
ncbi:MAG TPA: diadenylate cyclase, partial [Adhaeribacter sp.]|nr:diadenylate cyclase [Adhaeribacter sp.]